MVQKRFKFAEGSVELYAEKVANRGLCAVAQAESLRYKLLGGLAVRRCAAAARPCAAGVQHTQGEGGGDSRAPCSHVPVWAGPPPPPHAAHTRCGGTAAAPPTHARGGDACEGGG